MMTIPQIAIGVAICFALMEATPSIASEYSFITSALERTINQIRQGSVEIVGAKKSEAPKSDTVETPVRFFCAFDYDSELLRFDRTESIQYAQAKDNAGPKKTLTRTFGYCRLSDRTLELREQTVTIRSLQQESKKEANPFDVRLFGLLLHPDVVNPTKPEWVLGGYLLPETADVTKGADGVYVLKWQIDNDLERLLSIDSVHGFTPIRHELRSRNGQTELLSTAEWESQDGIWIPKRATLERRLNVYEKARTKNAKPIGVKVDKLSLSLNWAGINSKLSDATFSIEGFGLPKGAIVVDGRVAPPLVIERISTMRPPLRDFTVHIGGHSIGFFDYVVENEPLIAGIKKTHTLLILGPLGDYDVPFTATQGLVGFGLILAMLIVVPVAVLTVRWKKKRAVA